MQYTVKVCMLLAGCGRSRETRCFAGHADGHEKACAHTAFGNGQHPHVVFEKLWWQQVAMVEGQPVPLLSPHIVTAPSAGVSSAWTVIIVTHKVAKTADKYTIIKRPLLGCGRLARSLSSKRERERGNRE